LINGINHKVNPILYF